MRNNQIRTMVQSAILLAMGSALSLIPILEMPFGGSVTLLSMLPICLVGILHGPRWGFGTAFVYSVIQLMLSKCFAWGLTPTTLVVCILADYIVAFTVLGITGYYRENRKQICIGIAIALLLRMLCHYISGVTIWAAMAPEGWNPWIYSLVYNAFYMVPETAFTLIGTIIITSVPAMKKILNK